MKLENVRARIDQLDEKVLKLLNQRAQEVLKVSQIKKEKKLNSFSPEREAEILRRLKKNNRGPFSPSDVETVFGQVMSVCRAFHSGLRVAYLGPQGTFSHQAAIKKFGSKPKYISGDSIADVFDKVEKGEADYGVVPIENSIEGAINYTQDMFFDSPLKICSEVTLNISHNLIGKNLGGIKRIYSKDVVFPQCRKWLAINFPKAEIKVVSSTAEAALAAKKDPQGACIGSKILADIYGLRVLSVGLEDFSSNMTRFLVIAKEDSPVSGQDKTSLLFSIKDKVGALYDVLYSFKKYKINLSMIESRPSRKKAWDYYFFVDCEGHRSQPLFKNVLKELDKNCVFVKILGSYPKEG
jgi:chorismate mutase/prephenate dehydratase